MKTNVLLLFSCVLFLTIANAYVQEEAKGTIKTIDGVTFVKNPNRPVNDNAGRSIILKEIMRIEDDGVNFFFKLPWGIEVTNDGSIFIRDGDKLFLFDPDGKYRKNIVKKGQGPGEISGVSDFFVNNNELILFCGSMAKLLRTNLKGELIEEMFVNKKRVTSLIGHYTNKYFFVDILPANPERKEGIVDYNRNLIIYDELGNVTKTPFSFQIKSHLRVRTFSQGRSAVSGYFVTRLNRSIIAQKYVYLSHMQEYQIKQFDLEKQKISRIFSRDFSRVKCPSNKKGPLQSIKYHNDVHRLLIYGNNVWVLTSSFDTKKGILVDVFNAKGDYIDNFYLPLLRSNTNESFSQLYFPLRIKDNHLYAIEHDEDWTFSIGKYEIIDSY